MGLFSSFAGKARIASGRHDDCLDITNVTIEFTTTDDKVSRAI